MKENESRMDYFQVLDNIVSPDIATITTSYLIKENDQEREIRIKRDDLLKALGFEPKNDDVEVSLNVVIVGRILNSPRE